MNSSSDFSFIKSTSGSERLDSFVVAELEKEGRSTTRSQLQNLIKRGQVTVDGVVVQKPGITLREGNCVSGVLSEDREFNIAPYDAPLTVLFEDEHLIVVDKPADLVVHPGAGNRDKTLVNVLAHHFGKTVGEFPEPFRPGIVHRLDKDTSGVLVVARTVGVQASLQEQFSNRTVRRNYLALVMTTPRAAREVQRSSSGVIRTMITRDEKQRERMKVSEDKGRSAVTHWAVEENFAYGVLLRLKLETGRTHQIRVHMQHIGSPIVGDQVYGGPDILPRELELLSARFGRQALHAVTLGFEHPVTGESLFFESPVPEDMTLLIERFRDYK